MQNDVGANSCALAVSKVFGSLGHAKRILGNHTDLAVAFSLVKQAMAECNRVAKGESNSLSSSDVEADIASRNKVGHAVLLAQGFAQNALDHGYPGPPRAFQTCLEEGLINQDQHGAFAATD